MDVSLFVVKLVRRIRKGGLRATLGDAYRILFPPCAPDEFDIKYGTDTGGIDPLWKFKISSPNARYGVGSQSVKERNLVEAIELVPEDLQTFTFVDLGCGKGRALLIAARFAFKQVIGVEFVHELV